MKMKKAILLLGGARSGKSRYALELARGFRKKILVATLEGKDAEMRRRIRQHQRERGPGWQVIEAPLELARALARAQAAAELVVVDCITLWLSNLLLAGRSEKQIRAEAKNLCRLLKKARGRVIVISNEVGSGIVPDNRLSRDYRDLLGEINQMLAEYSDEVYLLLAGIPVRFKGGPE